MNIDYLNFSKSNNYYFEIINDKNGYFDKRSYVNKKLESISQNSLVFLSGNKFLYVILDGNEEKWLPYEKAKFFYDYCKLKEKYVLFIENDENYYGFIDGFPCVFTCDYESAKNLMEEYSKGEFVKIVGFGVVERKCHLKINYDDIVVNKKIEDPFKIDYLREEESIYGDDYKSFDDLFFAWYYKKNKKSVKNVILRSCFFVTVGVMCIIFSLF